MSSSRIGRNRQWENLAIKKVVPIASQAPRGGAPVTSISSVTGLYQQDAPPCPRLRCHHDSERRLL